MRSIRLVPAAGVLTLAATVASTVLGATPAEAVRVAVGARASSGVGAVPAAAASPVAFARPIHVTAAPDPGLEQRLERKMSHSTAGIYGLVVDIDGVGRVASIRPHRALRPASTQKLFTTLPLLLRDPQRRLTTSVGATAAPRHGVVRGNLVVHAAADPSLTRPALDRLAREVRHAGVRRVTGSLRLDIDSLPLRTRQSGWKWSFVPDDIGPLSPFPVARDWWRRTPAYLAHPTMHNLNFFRDKLVQHGVHINGRSRVVRSSGSTHLLASHRSRSIASLVRWTLTQSDNFFAETLLALEGGHGTVRRMTRAAGITDTSTATDGSGLSYDDRETAAGEVALLHYAQAGAAGPLLKGSLPVGCRTGTLKDRYCGTVGAGAVFAKTGTLDHTRALSGYTTDGLGRRVTFSVICSQVRSLTAAADATDRAVLVLRGYRGTP